MCGGGHASLITPQKCDKRLTPRCPTQGLGDASGLRRGRVLARISKRPMPREGHAKHNWKLVQVNEAPRCPTRGLGDASGQRRGRVLAQISKGPIPRDGHAKHNWELVQVKEALTKHNTRHKRMMSVLSGSENRKLCKFRAF